MDISSLTRGQQTALVLLRTLIGWHFLYEGFVKLVWPATGAALKCGPERAGASARACIAGFEAIDKKTRIDVEA